MAGTKKASKNIIETISSNVQNIFSFSWRRYKGQPFTLNESTLFTIPEVYACTKVLAETLASLPLSIYDRKKKEKLDMSEWNLVYLLKYAPNPQQTIYEFLFQSVVQLIRYGQFYAYIQRHTETKEIIGIYPIDNRYIIPVINEETGELAYQMAIKDGDSVLVPYNDVLVVKSFIDGGLLNNPVWKYQSDLLTNTKVVQNFAQDYFDGALNPTGVISSGENITQEQWNKFKDNFAQFTASTAEGNFLVLPLGLQFKEWNMDVTKTQMLELRKFNRNLVASIFRIPPSMIGDLEHSTFNNVEQQSLNFTKFCITPLITNFEKRLNIQLLSKLDLKKYYIEFDMSALERGDFATRVAAYSQGIFCGLYKPNECRQRENLPPVKNGDEVFISQSVASLTTMDKKAEQVELQNEQIQQTIENDTIQEN